MSKKLMMVMALAVFMSASVLGQWSQPNAAQCDPQQMFAQYQAWFQNADMQLQQRRQLLVQLMYSGGMPMPSPVPFPGISSGGGSAYRCAACNGTGNCRLCKGSGMYIISCYSGIDKSDHSTCPQCRGSGRCQSCSRYKIRRLD